VRALGPLNWNGPIPATAYKSVKEEVPA